MLWDCQEVLYIAPGKCIHGLVLLLQVLVLLFTLPLLSTHAAVGAAAPC